MPHSHTESVAGEQPPTLPLAFKWKNDMDKWNHSRQFERLRRLQRVGLSPSGSLRSSRVTGLF